MMLRIPNNRLPRPCGVGSSVVVPVGGIAEPCLGCGRQIRGAAACPAPVEQ